MIHSIQLALKAFEPLVLKRVTQTFQTMRQQLHRDVPKSGRCIAVGLPTKTKKFTVLRSPHVNKKSREQFEVQTVKTLLVGVANVPCAQRKNMLSTCKHKGFSGVQMRCTVQYATSLSGV
jgi:small subunit ribosomal protein S10